MKSEPGSLLEVQLERSGFRIDLRLEWQVKTLVLFGASGSGKTTLLRVLLGLEPEAKARARLAGDWLEDPEAGLRVPVHQRRLGWVPQSPTLFPDRSVEANIRFGAQPRGETPWIQQAIEVLELGSLLHRGVADLSGGEGQRVALARAIATRPRALLLDEPMASLDMGLRARVLPYLLRIRDEFELPLVYITHDPDEAILLGDKIAVLDGGQLIAQGAPREVLWSQAVHSLTTHLSVENVFEVACLGAGGRSTRVRTMQGLELETPWPLVAGENLTLGIRAEDILVSLDRPSRISARNLCPGRVARIDAQSDHLLVHVDVGADRLTAKLTEGAVEDLCLTPGSDVYLIIKSQALRRIR
jgi:molybdate transport system ATP-binding protein